MSNFQLAFTRLMALIYKEFVVMLMDKGTRKILVLPIIIQSILFGYGATFNLEHVPFVIYQDSNDKVATEIVRRVSNSPAFAQVKYCKDELCYKQTLDHGDALLGIFIASDFHKTKTIFIATDARNTASANTAASYVQSIVASYNNEQKKIKGIYGGISVEHRYLYNVNNITQYSILTGMILALSMIQVMMLSSLSVSREREEGTFDMMLLAPLNPVEILIGKALPPTIVAITQGLALFLICVLWFDIAFQGNFFSFLFVISTFSLCTVGIGLAISALSSTSQQSVVIAFTIVLPSIILSGMITPRSAMPELMQYFTLVNPFYYGLEALRRIYLEGQELMNVIHLLIPLFGLGAVSMGTAVALFRGKLG